MELFIAAVLRGYVSRFIIQIFRKTLVKYLPYKDPIVNKIIIRVLVTLDHLAVIAHLNDWIITWEFSWLLPLKDQNACAHALR